MSTVVKFSGREVEVKTLTVRQVKDYVEQMAAAAEEQAGLPVLDMLFNDDVPASAVALATGLSIEELTGDVLPSQVRELWDVVRAENPFFVGMMERMVMAGRSTGHPSSGRSAT